VQVIGIENLPDPDLKPAPVYICNHASQIDAAAVYFFDRRFKWIAKQSILYLPGVGLVMFLAKHVLIQRKGRNNKSVSNLFEKADAAVQSGIPMFFFPQGTRRISEKLPFKDGAFIVAQNNNSLLVPLSIEIPHNVWNTWYPISLLWSDDRPTVRLTIHKPIANVASRDREEIKAQSMQQIYSVLPETADCCKEN
jgi:1-acyl-sn-glycerol-3-phosphate acyltransferase